MFLDSLMRDVLIATRDQSIQNFAITYKAAGRRGPLLDPDAIMAVPAALVLPLTVVKMRPFSGRTLQALRRYRARV